jgi:hypothetical protein
MGALKNLLSLGITVGLSDRQQFVEKAAGIITKYQHDPEAAERLAEGVVQYLEQLQHDIRLQRNIQGAMPTDEINRLSQAMEELTAELKKQKRG